MFRNTVKILLSIFSFCLLFACAGEPGNNGVAGTSCEISDNGDGTKTIRCDDGTSAVIQDGRNGYSGATGATGAPGETGDPGDDGEDGEDGIDGTDCTVVDNGDGTATITCDDGTTVIIGTPTTSDTDAGMSEEVADAGMSEEDVDAGVIEDVADAGTVEEEATDAGSTTETSGFSFSYGFEDDDYNAPSVTPLTYNDSDDVWANVTSLDAVTTASEGTHFWGMQDLRNPFTNDEATYHIMTFGPYDVSSFGGGTFSFDYFTVGFDNDDNIGFALLLDNTTLPNLDISDAALVMLTSDTVGEWTNQTGSFGESASAVTIVVAASQNGTDDYAGVDNFVLTCDNCQAPSVTSCAAGATLTLPTTAADGSCVDCVEGTYDDDADDSTACIAHAMTDCSDGETLTPGTATADGSCAVCESGEYDGDGDALTECSSHTVTDCNQGETLTEGTTTSNGSCVACASGTWDHDSTDTTACIDHTTLTAAECSAGQEFNVGDAETDNRCDDCETGTWDHDDDRATQCQDHTVLGCPAGQEATAGTATSDVSCSDCAEGFYDVDGATGNLACVAHTSSCSAGNSYTAGTLTADATCTACEGGNFQPNNDSAATSCTPWSATCPVGEGVATAATATSDTTCEACTVGIDWNNTDDATNVCVAVSTPDCGDVTDSALVAALVTADAYCGCNENFFAVGDGSCSACTSGTNAAGDDAAGSASTCDE